MRSLMTEYQRNLITAEMNALVVTLNQKADALEKCGEDGSIQQYVSRTLYHARAHQRLLGFTQGLECMGVWLDVHYTELEHGRVQRVTGWEFI